MLLSGPLSIASALGIVIDALNDQPCYAAEFFWLQSALEETQMIGIQALKYANA
jgi:hypothetical protein